MNSIIVCLMVLSSLVVSENALVVPYKSIVILAGQSNMAGRGGVIVNNTWDGIVPPECQSDPVILRLNAQLTWDEALEPLHQDIDVNKTCGGRAWDGVCKLSFEEGSQHWGDGFGPVCRWRNQHKPVETWWFPLQSADISRAQAAVLNGGGLIRAILWYQGESDTATYEGAVSYKRRLEKFFTDVRSDLLSPLLPIIQVALASGNASYIDIVRKAQLEMEIELPNVGCVDAKGLELQPDGLHLSTAAQVRVGEMLASTFLQICEPKKKFHH